MWWIKRGVWVNFWKVGFSWSRHTFLLSSSKQLFNTKLVNFKRSRPIFVVTFWRSQDLTFFNITISHFYLGALFADRCNSFWFGMLFKIKVSLFMKIKLIFNFLIAGTFLDRSALFYFFAKVYFYLFHTFFEDKVKF